MTTSAQSVRRFRWPRPRRSLAGLLALACCLSSGCAVSTADLLTPPWKRGGAEAKFKDAPQDTMVLRGNGLEKDRALDADTQAELDNARRLFQDKEYASAEAAYHKIADRRLPNSEQNVFTKIVGTQLADSKVNWPLVEESLYYEAECQRLQKNYRDASSTYKKLLENFRQTQYTQKAAQGLFEIADYWLTATRAEMDEYHEKVQGKRWFVLPASYLHFGKDQPLMDTEGHAVILLDTIRLYDINGPLAEKSLYYLGTVKFYRRDYREADSYFKQLYENYPNSDYAPRAIKQSVICKQLCTGGSVYDCRSVEESKKLIQVAQNAYPELAKDERWIEQQLVSINTQQADRDMKIAQHYQRTGHPGSAYFYFELVRRRYPNTTYAEQATQRMNEIRARADTELQQTRTNEQQDVRNRQTTTEGGNRDAAPRLLPSILTPR